jgi:NAD(P)-dependent dehydrogenase (short-subunit alcohol dehydrogenase family)
MPSAEDAVLAGHVVLVTGGSTGIGCACAEAALAAGASVVIAARGESDLEQARQRLEATRAAAAGGATPRVLAVPCDVSDAAAVHALIERVDGELGGVNGLVHAAAVIGPIGTVLDVDPDAWLDTIRINLFGTFLVARAAASSMRLRGGGRIVLLSGGGGTSAFPNFSAYGCSKAGVVRLAETLATELAASDIEVNALAPGFVATRIHDATLQAGTRAGAEYLQRTRDQLAQGGVPAGLAAAAAVFLLSPHSAGITGRLLAVPWDDYRQWPGHLPEIRDSDLFQLRRIVPRDRGAAWQ